MLKRLLADRFKLRTHVETRLISGYRLTLAKAGTLGPDLARAMVDCEKARNTPPSVSPSMSRPPLCAQPSNVTPTSATLHESGPIALLVTRLRLFAGRPIVDETHLDGLYEWKIIFRRDRSPATDSPLPLLETALSDQLGLKLVAQESPSEVVVIDNLEMPSSD
jgi:uncharacterized protein (TIGR03435 family)